VDIVTAAEQATKGKLLPVYLLAGDEQLLITRCADAIRLAAVGGGPRGLSEDIFDAKQSNAASIITACRTLPMMSKRRLVTVRGCQDMRKADQEALLAYFEKPEPSTVLLLVGPGFDLRVKLALAAKDRAWLLVARPPSEGDLVPWIEREAKAAGVTLDHGAAESLALSVGADLSLLADGLERLGLYTAGAPVTAKTVDEVITPVREIPAWDLAEAVGQRNLPSCLGVLARLTAQRQHALPTLGLVARQIHLIAKARTHVDTRSTAPLASALKLPPFAADKIAQQAKRWSPALIQRALRVLAATDAALKGAKRGDERVMEECLIALCGAAGMGEAAAR
jgi:DNA polymerase-3 subunit delta